MSDDRRSRVRTSLRVPPEPTAESPVSSRIGIVRAALQWAILSVGLPIAVAVDLATALGASAARSVAKPVIRWGGARRDGPTGERAEQRADVIVLRE
jgi:hypothetical protein